MTLRSPRDQRQARLLLDWVQRQYWAGKNAIQGLNFLSQICEGFIPHKQRSLRSMSRYLSNPRTWQQQSIATPSPSFSPPHRDNHWPRPQKGLFQRKVYLDSYLATFPLGYFEKKNHKNVKFGACFNNKIGGHNFVLCLWCMCVFWPCGRGNLWPGPQKGLFQHKAYLDSYLGTFPLGYFEKKITKKQSLVLVLTTKYAGTILCPACACMCVF